MISQGFRLWLVFSIALTGALQLAHGEVKNAANRLVPIPAVGIEKPIPGHPPNTDKTTTLEFMPYSTGIQQNPAGISFIVPEGDPVMNYRYVGVGPFPIQAMRRNRLHAVVETAAAPFYGILMGTFLKAGRPVKFNVIANFNSKGEGTREVAADFSVAPSADQMILWIGVSGLGKKVVPGQKMTFKQLEIHDLGAMNGGAASSPLFGENLLPVADFENHEIGPYATSKTFYLGNSTAEIVQDGSKCLRIVRKNSYRYPHFRGKAVNLDNCWVELSCRVKGKGNVSPGIWWWRPVPKWDYQNGPGFELTDQWQTLTFRQYCVDPDTQYAAAAWCLNTKEAELFVDDVKMSIIAPE